MRRNIKFFPGVGWLAVAFAAWLAGPSSPATAQPTLSEQIAGLVSRVQPLDTNTVPPGQLTPPARYFTTSDGYIRFLSAAAGHHLPSDASNDPPATVARAFITQNAPVFGVRSPQVTFEPLKVRSGTNRTTVRLQQTYAGIPVFAAHVNVQVTSRGGIANASGDIERNFQIFDNGTVSTTPTLSATGILATVRSQAAARYPGAVITTTQPRLTIFAPSVLGRDGSPRLVWHVDTGCDTAIALNQRLLIDAHTGETVRAYPLYYSALDRRVSDANNTTSASGTLVRSEGDGPCGITDADDAYFFLGDAYDFYDSHHGRDSINDSGMKLKATVRYCDPADPCPWNNACWTSGSERILFGESHVTDDIVAHEYTHGVTDHTSDLVYEDTSGAINESFSDIWGEFVDLSNGHGNDDPTNRWYVAEEHPGGAMRYMKDPTWKDDPDRRGSIYYIPPGSTTNDYGGVHSNSGVGNKLCYLLTDGDTFNGYTVTGQGVTAVADLFYEVQVNLLTSGADWTDLYLSLSEAAVNLSWSMGRRNNLYRACKAVEIAQEQEVYVDGDGSNLIQTGSASYPFHTVAQGVSSAFPGDLIYIHAGSYDETLVIDKAMQLLPQSGSVVLGE